MIYLFWAYSYGLTADRLRLYYRDFARIPTTVPAIQEQKKFAAALVAWDKSIMVVEKMLKNLVRQRLGLFYGLLDGQFLQKPRRQTIKVPRLEPATIDSQENKGSFPESVQPGIPRLQPTPRGWQRRCLGLYLSEVRRPVDLEQDRQYTLVTVKRSRGGVQQRSVLRGSEIKTATQFYIREGDFLISRRQIVHGACGIVPSELDGAIVSNEYIAFTANEGLNMRFLRYLSELKYFQQTCFHSSVGVHVEKMIFRAERWLRWPFNIPPICEQEGIAAILDDATAEVDAASRQLAALRKEKLALMQQILMSNGRATFDSVA
ncbi:MAG: restriction endonuclease subunit S [Dokdonella sp.]